MKDVLVILVTFNRKECLKNLINSLFVSAYKIKGILILDNHGTDGTIDELKKMKYINEEEIIEEEVFHSVLNDVDCYYYRNKENSGGAGGFSKAVKLSLQFEYDFLWIMDDDVLPHKNCLGNLLKNMDETHLMCIPNRTCTNFKDRACIEMELKKRPALDFGYRKQFVQELKEEKYDVVDMPFEGPIIDRKIVEKVGFPNSEYFIFFDDTDYATRCREYTKIYFVTDAILERQLPSNTGIVKTKNWRNYYYERNTLIFMKKYGKGFWGKRFFPVFWQLVIVFKSLIRFRFHNVKVSWKALIDGIRNKTGKTVIPGRL